MKNNERVLYGILITAGVFAISTFVGSRLNQGLVNVPYVFFTHTLMLMLSVAVILGMHNQVNFKIALPQFKKTLKPALLGLLTAIVVNILFTIITMIFGGKVEIHSALTRLSPLQVFVFVFIYASIAEEILFRGFLMNILKPIKAKGINIFSRNLSIPVLISAIAFGLAHIILATTGASGLFVFRIVVFTTILGLVSGYYQEKYDNIAFAIIVHMSGNLLGVLGAVLMNQ
jgi:membrane protease YdiL (CAAX protease family)